MRLTQRTDYALRVLMLLAVEEGPRTAAEMAAMLGVSEHHLAKIAKDLRARGHLETRRGRGGGFRLARSPADITVGGVVRELEDLTIVECFDPGQSRCPLAGPCALQGALAEARDAFLDVLDGYSLADLVAPRRALSRLLRLSRVEVR